MFKQGIAPLAVLAACVLAAPAQAAGGLELVTVAQLGDGASVVRVADFNGDGIDDFAMGSDCGVTTLQGTYAPPTGMPPALVRPDGSLGPCGSNAGVSLAVGDVNGDHALDIVAATTIGSSFSVYTGRGDGTFNAATSYPIAAQPSEIVTGDLNGDGRADVIVRTDTSIDVLLATPAGFAAPVSHGGFQRTFSVATGHTDAGATLDVVAAVGVSNTSSGVVNFGGNGDGTLAAGRYTNTNAQGAGLFTARLRPGLGRDDVVMTGGALATLLTGADGALTVGRERIDHSWGGGAAADFDGDGDLDVAAAGHRDFAGIVVHFNDGAGILDTQRRYDSTWMSPLTSVQTADVNGDGHEDVVAIAAGTLYTLRNFPSLAADAAPAAFENVTVGAQSTPRTVTFRNTGVRPVPVTGVRVSERLARPVFAATADGCSGRTLAVNGTCSVTVVFKPTAVDRFEAHVEIGEGQASAGTLIAGTGIAAPIVDTTAPTVTAKIAKQKLKTVLSRGLKITAGCSEACTVKASLRLKNREVAKRSAKLTGKAKSLALKLTATGKKALKKARGGKLTLRLTVTDAAGNTRTTTRTITVR